MKILILSLICSFLSLSCGNSGKGEPVFHAIPNLTIIVYDISLSNDQFAVLDTTHFNTVYYKIGCAGGGNIYGLLIKSNSQKQEPVAYDIPALDTLRLKGNTYQQQNRTKRNRQIRAEFENGETAFVKTFSEKLVLPKNEKFSDIQHALELAKNTLENPLYANYAKQLIIISDMENDFPPKNGIDAMTPVKFENDVKIGVVRPSGRTNVSEMLGGTKYTVYTTINDAINGLFHNQN